MLEAPPAVQRFVNPNDVGFVTCNWEADTDDIQQLFDSVFGNMLWIHLNAHTRVICAGNVYDLWTVVIDENLNTFSRELLTIRESVGQPFRGFFHEQNLSMDEEEEEEYVPKRVRE